VHDAKPQGAAMKVILSLVLGLLLGGCMLQSKTANFSETDGLLALGKSGGTYLSYNLDAGVWKSDAKPVTFKVVGSHYEVTEKGKTTQVLFVPVKGTWTVVQFIDDGKAFVYALADVQKDAVYIHPLICTDLQKIAVAKPIVNFVMDDCFLKKPLKAKGFQSLVASAGPRELKFLSTK
jgi:hypothetical protein